MPSNTKIEHRALNALESLIDNHSLMDYQFNSNDKEMSWDGYITLFKGSGNDSKKDFLSRIPVQIKGHLDHSKKHLGKRKINRSVEVDDLKAFATEKGVIYFQIFVGGEQRDVYYSSLFPSKIVDYLELAKKRGNKNTLSIPFRRIENGSKQLFDAVMQFDHESKKQGTGFTPLVQNRIRLDELDKLTNISLTVQGPINTYSTLFQLSSGDVCLYGRLGDDKYDRPIEWSDNAVFFSGTDVYQSIKISGEVFYSSYRCFASSEGEIVIQPSSNLFLSLTKGGIEFRPVTAIKELYNDAKFLLRLKEIKAYQIVDQTISLPDFDFSEGFEDKLTFIIDSYETLDMIAVEIPTKNKDFSELQMRQIHELVRLKRGCYNERFPDGLSRYVWTYDGKKVPLLVKKTENTLSLSNAVYGKTYDIFLPDERYPEALGYRMPIFIYQDVDILANLYVYDYDALLEQIKQCDSNSLTARALTDCVLKMICVYDLNNDKHFLELGSNLLDMIEEYEDADLILLNRLQIKKRQKGLSAEDIEMLSNKKYDNVYLEFGRVVLLEDKEHATRLFSRFSEEGKDYYRASPIFKLYSELL